jgi:hypothetical protein
MFSGDSHPPMGQMASRASLTLGIGDVTLSKIENTSVLMNVQSGEDTQATKRYTFHIEPQTVKGCEWDFKYESELTTRIGETPDLVSLVQGCSRHHYRTGLVELGNSFARSSDFPEETRNPNLYLNLLIFKSQFNFKIKLLH